MFKLIHVRWFLSLVLAGISSLAMVLPVSAEFLALDRLVATRGQTPLTMLDDADAFHGFIVPAKPTLQTHHVDITAYTSSPEETDDSPFISADGSRVFDGMVAANFLPFRTKIRIPQYFGERVFEVRDRMNSKFFKRMDIWMLTKKEAREWGFRRKVRVEIVELGDNSTQWKSWIMPVL